MEAVRGAADPSGGWKLADSRDAPASAFMRNRPLLLGHRGARPTSRFSLKRKAQVPQENTVDCFEYALSQGVDGFEFDVHVTRDHRLVICHNAWVGGSKVSASSYDTLCSRGGPFACLETILRAFAHRAYLDIEVKVEGAEEAIVAAVYRYRPQRGFVISSFHPGALQRFHEIDASLPLGYVCQRAASLPRWRKLPVQILLPHYKLLTKKLVDEVHQRGLRAITWTVNGEQSLRQVAEWGIDGVISDDPALLSRTFRSPRALANSE